MTAILALLSNLFAFLKGLWKHLSDRRLVRAGEDKADKEAAEGILELLEKIKKATPPPLDKDPDRRKD